MQSRQPTISLGPSTLGSSTSMRRRSGGNSSKQPRQSLAVQVEDADVGYAQPTVLLVRRSQPSPILPSLPAFYPDSRITAHGASPPMPTIALDIDPAKPAPFIPIPLTPRPEAPSRGTSETSLQSTQTHVSQISRLPTPDFTDTKSKTKVSPNLGLLRSYLPRLPIPDYADRKRKNTTSSNPGSIYSYLPRGPSYISFRVHGPPGSFPSRARTSYSYSSKVRPQSIRAGSSVESFRSTWSTSSGSSSDSGHHALIPAIGTTDKFTHKWPRPQSLRNLEVRGGGDTGMGLGQAAMLALEEGQGLGMDKVERWTSYKWCLLASVVSVFAYGGTGLVYAILTWFRTWDRADVMYVADSDILILITLASSILIFTALVGTSGALLNSRPILAIYALLLWPALISILAVGYTSYKRSTFSLDHKLNHSWSQYYTPLGRLLIQDSLRCCGFYSALHEATPSKRCYPRTPLPGCKGKLYRFEKENLEAVWSAAFALASMHLLNVVAALLCANHTTRTFGKGITPKKYRLSGGDVRQDAERILKGVGERGVVRPEMSRASSSGVFREDRKESTAQSMR